MAENPNQNQQKQGYGAWAKESYNKQYENWVPWMEDQYLRWFGKDNKASYVAKDELGKTKVTGIKQVDQLQDDVNNLVGNQVGKGGLAQPLGDFASKEGLNRAERGGKDEHGSYGGPLGGVTDPVVDNSKKAGSGVYDGAASAGSSVTSGAKNAGGYIGGFFGGKK